MKKFIDRVGAFLLATISIFSLGYKKVKAEEINNSDIKITSNNSNEETSRTDNNSYSEENIDSYIDILTTYYKSANITRDCIVMLNYPYLKAHNYNLNSNISSSDLEFVKSIKNTQYGWNTLRIAFVMRGDDSNKEYSAEEWRELEKLYLVNFVKELEQTRVIKYYPLLLDEGERNDAKDLEDLCYSIYQEYYNSNGNINSIKLNALLIKLIEKIDNEELYDNKTNGYYMIVSEILGQFHSVFTLIDNRYNELGSKVSNRIMNCNYKCMDLITYIITNENVFDEKYGLYCHHPYENEYIKSENAYSRLITKMSGQNIINSRSHKPIVDVIKVKKYYVNRLNSVLKLTNQYSINYDISNNNFFQVLNYEYFKKNNLITSDDDTKIVYDNLATIYRININTMNNYYNPNSYNYRDNLSGNNYTSLILPYSDLLLSKDDYNKSKKVENKYLELINDYILSIGVIYGNEPNTNIIYNTHPEYYNNLETKLNDILGLLDNIENHDHSEALDISLSIIIKQMNDYIERIVLDESNFNIPNKGIIIELINEINKKSNKLFGNHLETIMISLEEQIKKEAQSSNYVKSRNCSY